MNEDRFDELMRDAAQSYRNPPQADFDGMWTEIESRSSFGADTSHVFAGHKRRSTTWLYIAATLVIGVGLGRASASLGHGPAAPAAMPVATVAAAHVDSSLNSVNVANNPYEAETSKYLGQTAALLIALPSEIKGGRANQQFVARAGDLLTTTRLLIDSPASNDPSMRNLLEDLELVLAQVVRLQNNHSRTELDLINRALEQRDVIPRLRTAVGDYSAN